MKIEVSDVSTPDDKLAIHISKQRKGEKTKAEKELEDYHLFIEESQSPDRTEIDFSVNDGEDNVAWVWGKKGYIEVECNHPLEPDYDDDETVGECPLCGATCTWHWQASADDGYVIKERVPDEWTMPGNPGGLLGEYINETMGEKGE